MSLLLCTNNGSGLPCRTIAGVSPYGVFLAPWECPANIGNLPTAGPQLSYVFNADGSIGTFSSGATAISGGGYSNYSPLFQQYCQDDEVGSLISTPDASNIKANGTFYSANAVEFTMFDYSQALQNEVNILLGGRWQGIVLGNDQNFYFFGLNHPASVTTAVGGINKMMGDLNGMTLTLESHEPFGLTLITGTQGGNPNATKAEIFKSASFAVEGLLSYNIN